MAHQPVASTSTSRSLRERKKRKYDFDNSSSDDEPDQLKRATRRKPSGAPLVRRNKRSGKLASFVNMPLDVLFEIFGHLHPYDLLRLTRTTKEFRRILLHRSSISTWKASFEIVPNLPDCPPEMCEPAWANLAFSPHCHYCSTTGVRHVEWKFRVRICSKCAPTQLIEAEFVETLDPLFRGIPGGVGRLPDAIGASFAGIIPLVPNRGGKRYKRVFLREQLIEFRDKINSVVDDDEKRNAYLEERHKWIEQLNIHAANCEAWAHNQADDRNEELGKLRKERRDAIVKKLEELGYKKDIQFRNTPIEMESLPFANKPQRLTDRVWKNIKAAAIAYIENVRTTRLKAEHHDLVLARRGLACQYLRNYKNGHLPCLDIYPEPPDFCEFEPVKRICNQPSDVVVDLSSFNVLNDTISDLIKRWRKDVHSGIRNVFLKNMTASFAPGKFNLPDWTNDPAALRQRMSLATAVFVCEQCSRRGFDSSPYEDLDFGGLSFWDDEDEYYDFDDTPRATKPMFYPQVMAHPCLTRFTLKNTFFLAELYEASASNPRRDPSTYLDARLKQRQKWNSDRITLDKQGAKVAEQVVAMVGLDPAVATTSEMDALDRRFKCTECLGPSKATSRSPPSETGMSDDDELEPDADRYLIMTWRAAVKHQMDRHIRGIDPSDMMAPEHLRQPTLTMDNLRLLDAADPLIPQAKEKEESLLNTEAPVWCCALCRDSTQEPEGPITLVDLKRHLKAKHKLDDPVLDRDYYKHFAASDIMNVPECVPWVAERA